MTNAEMEELLAAMKHVGITTIPPEPKPDDEEEDEDSEEEDDEEGDDEGEKV